jgi:hypothetical protein
LCFGGHLGIAYYWGNLYIDLNNHLCVFNFLARRSVCLVGDIVILLKT